MELLEVVKKTLIEKQAKNITIIDMREVNPYTDYFVVCTSKNNRHGANLADYVEDEATKEGYDVRTVEGDRNSDWILADLNEVVVHIMTPEAREQYRIESLWADQPQEVIEEDEVAY